MATTIHDEVSATLAAGASHTYAYDVGAGQTTRSFFLVNLSSLGMMRVQLYVQSPTNTSNRLAGLVPKGGAYGRRLEIKTDASTPIQVPAGQSLLVVITNLEAATNKVIGFVNGSF